MVQNWERSATRLYVVAIMRNAGMDELQAGTKIAGRNMNNLRYADDYQWQKAKRN